MFKSYTLTAPVGVVFAASANLSVYVALPPAGAGTLLMLEPTFANVGAELELDLVLPLASTKRVLTSVTGFEPAGGFSVV